MKTGAGAGIGNPPAGWAFMRSAARGVWGVRRFEREKRLFQTEPPNNKQTAPKTNRPNKQMPSAGRDGACHDSVTCAAAALCAAPKDGIVSDCGQPPCFAPRLVMTCNFGVGVECRPCSASCRAELRATQRERRR
jgi:hypothetical protein